MSYTAETRHVWKDTHEFKLIAPDGTEVAKFHAEASAIWGISSMLRELGKRERIDFDLPKDPENEPLAEDPSWR